jgi:hypothetical protein
MGFFKDVNELRKMGKEASNNFDAKATMADGMARMQEAQAMMAQQTAATTLATTGEAATAQVLASRDTGSQINMQPIVEVDLLVTRSTGGAPYPVTVRQMIPTAQLGLVAPGSTISVRVDPANPSTVLI